MRIETSTNIAAPMARVWELTIDVESWPKLTPTMTSVVRLDTVPLEIGSVVRVKQPGQKARLWTVTAMEAERCFAWSTNLFGTIMTATHALYPSEAGTTNTLAVDINGRLSPLIGALLRRPIAKAIETENEGFKTAAER